jgi:hypothetical protein
MVSYLKKFKNVHNIKTDQIEDEIIMIDFFDRIFKMNWKFKLYPIKLLLI